MVSGVRLSFEGVAAAKASLKRRESLVIDPKPSDLSMTRVKHV